MQVFHWCEGGRARRVSAFLIEDFALSPDGSRLAVAHADARVRIWHLDRLEIERTLSSPTEGSVNISDVSYLPGSERIATVGGDLTVRLWDAVTGNLLAVHHGHDRPILTVAAAPEGRWLYTGGSGGRVRFWDMDALDPARTAWPILPAPAATERALWRAGEAQRGSPCLRGRTADGIVDQHRDHEHRAEEDLKPVGVDAGHHDALLHHAENQRAEHRTGG